jgi:hypothetical protein
MRYERHYSQQIKLESSRKRVILTHRNAILIDRSGKGGNTRYNVDNQCFRGQQKELQGSNMGATFSCHSEKMAKFSHIFNHQLNQQYF